MRHYLKMIKTSFLKKFNFESIHQGDSVPYKKKRKIIDNYRKKFDVDILIETGTFLGDTIQYFREKFKTIYTIELSIDLARRAVKRFETDYNIKVIQGNSAEVLKQLVPALDKAALFWLDGHYSSEFFYNGEYIITAKGEKNTPIEEELDIILNSKYSNIILIDDARLFNGEHDYPTITNLKQKLILSGRNYTLQVFDDIIHILPSFNK